MRYYGPIILFLLFDFIAQAAPDTATQVIQNPGWQVGRLTLIGNKTLSRSAIKNIGLQLYPGWFHKPAFSHSKLQRDTLLIKQFYRSNGFLRTLLQADTSVIDTARRRIQLSITIQEGPRTLVSEIRVIGIPPADQTKLLKQASLHSGEPLQLMNAEKDAQTFSNLLGDDGYLEAVVSINFHFIRDSLLVGVEYAVATGPHIRVASTDIVGLKGVNPTVVTRSLDFKTGEVLTRPELRKTINNLYVRNLFSFVSLSFDSHASQDATNDSSRIIRATLIESKFFSSEWSVGYQSYEQFRTRLRLSYSNFAGYGITGYGAGYLNTIRRGAETGMTIPFIFGWPVDYDTRISYFYQNEPRIQLAGFFTAWHNSLIFPVSQYWHASLTHRLETVRLTMIPPVLADSIGKPLTHSVGFEVTRDSRDDIFDAHTGTYLNGLTEISGLSGSNSNHFVKMEGDNRIYHPWLSCVLASSLRYGLQIPYGASAILPVQERFYLGGASIMRGFADKTAGPDSVGTPTGGTLYLAMNVAELRYPIYERFTGNVFLDAGNLWKVDSRSLSDYWRTLSKFSLRYNAGFGFRFHFPIVIVAVDVGFKLDKRRNEDMAAFHVNIGNSF